MKKPKKKLSICIEPELDNVLDKGGFNKSKLINSLLKKHMENNKQLNSVVKTKKEKKNNK